MLHGKMLRHLLLCWVVVTPLRALAEEEELPTRWVFNLGLGLGVASVFKLEAQHRESDQFFSLGLGSAAYHTEFYGSYNWKSDGDPVGHYWTVGGGIVHTSLTIFGIQLASNLPEIYGGWGYEWLRPSHRHAVEIHVGYPQVATVHYLFGL